MTLIYLCSVCALKTQYPLSDDCADNDDISRREPHFARSITPRIMSVGCAQVTIAGSTRLSEQATTITSGRWPSVARLRVFEPTSYYSIDYIDQELKVFPLSGRQTDIKTFKIKKEEPLKKELENFLRCQVEG